MSYRLYYAEDSAAMGVRVILEEIQAPYELLSTSISMDARTTSTLDPATSCHVVGISLVVKPALLS